jgi:selenoprotein W-related protein
LHDYFPKIDGLTLVPGSGGVFDVTLDGKLVYSKRQTGAFPDPEALTSEIGAKLGA